MKSSDRKIIIPATDYMDIAYSSYFYGEKSLPHRQRLNERNKSLNIDELSYRVINHWEKSGLIDVDRGEAGTGWRKYSTMDIIWINLITELRKFGVSIENIGNIKDRLIENNELHKPSAYPMLEFYTSLFMRDMEETYVLIPENFVVEIATQSEIEFSKAIGRMSNHISISLHDIIKRTYKKNDLKLKNDTKVTLTKEETILLDEIRSGTYKTIEVKMKDGKLYQLNKEIIHSADQLEKLLRDKSYSDIVLKKENGKVVYAQEIIKQRL